MSGFASKPRALSCYLCGAQFGTQSLLIHAKSCQKKWAQQQGQLAKDKRRPLPPPPPELADPDDPSQLAFSKDQIKLPNKPDDVDAFNARMISLWGQVSLQICNHCGRSFTVEPFERHQKVCTAGKPFKPLSKTTDKLGTGRATGSGPTRGEGQSSTAPAGSLSSEKGSSLLPRSYLCYLCCRGFMNSSLGIHLPQCAEKWEEDEGRRPTGQRRSLPTPPAELADASDPTVVRRFKDGVKEGVLPRDPEAIEAFNKRMQFAFQAGSLTPCASCGRTFNWESLARHQKSCTAANPMARAGGKAGSKAADLALSATVPPGSIEATSPWGAAKGSGGGRSPGPRSFMCYLCGKSFMSKSLGIHLPLCLIKWEAEEERRPQKDQRPTPRPPPELADPNDPDQLRLFKDGIEEGILPGKPADIEAFNKRMGAYWYEASLASCPNCGRTFNIEAFEKHKKLCTPERPMKASTAAKSKTKLCLASAQSQLSSSSSPGKPGSHSPLGSSAPGPRSYICFLCGRGFMSKSLGIHLPQCLTKWEAEEQRRPAGLQRPLPVPPLELADPANPNSLRRFKDGVEEGALPRQLADIEAFNNRMLAAHEQSTQVQCSFCGRTFNWEALERHSKSCTPDNPIRGPRGSCL